MKNCYSYLTDFASLTARQSPIKVVERYRGLRNGLHMERKAIMNFGQQVQREGFRKDLAMGWYPKSIILSFIALIHLQCCNATISGLLPAISGPQRNPPPYARANQLKPSSAIAWAAFTLSAVGGFRSILNTP
jgi:hypothetical protein